MKLGASLGPPKTWDKLWWCSKCGELAGGKANTWVNGAGQLGCDPPDATLRDPWATPRSSPSEKWGSHDVKCHGLLHTCKEYRCLKSDLWHELSMAAGWGAAAPFGGKHQGCDSTYDKLVEDMRTQCPACVIRHMSRGKPRHSRDWKLAQGLWDNLRKQGTVWLVPFFRRCCGGKGGRLDESLSLELQLWNTTWYVRLQAPRSLQPNCDTLKTIRVFSSHNFYKIA
jgi:hypothetical protein